MLISRARTIDINDQGRFAWSALAKYQNVGHAVTAIDKLHQLNGSGRKNVVKQAEQIRYCLVQAFEYKRAAEVVGLSTRPLLYYYSAMSLALAQILMKGSGDVSLDRARGKNAHHGLTLKGAESLRSLSQFSDIAGSIKAIPLEHAGGNRFGTFDLWHQLARDLPDAGIVKRRFENGVSETFETLGIPDDSRFPLVPSSGVSLLSCYKCIPQMREFLHQHDVPSSVVKANINMELDERNKTAMLNLIIQPAGKKALDGVYEKVEFKSYRESTTVIHDYGDGCAITITTKNDDSEEFRMPSSLQTRADCIFLYSELECLNEFGLFYVALYILGNYARYFPDQWMKDVEGYSTMALAADELMVHADHRLALLTLAELDRCAYLPK